MWGWASVPVCAALGLVGGGGWSTTPVELNATLGCREESKVCLTVGVSQCLPSPVSPCVCGYLLSKTFPSPEGPGDSSDQLRRLFSRPHKVVALGTSPLCPVTKGPRATWLWLWSLLSPLCPKTFQWDIYAQRTEPNSFTSWDGSQVSTAQHLSALPMGLCAA